MKIVTTAVQPPKTRRPRKQSVEKSPAVATTTAPAKPKRKQVSNLKLLVHTAPDAVVEPLLSVGLLEGLLPERGANSRMRPLGQSGKRIKTSRK